MTKVFKYCFDKWWQPLIFFGLTTLFFGVSEIVSNHKLIEYSLYLFVFGLFGLIVSTVYQLTKKKWLFAFLTISTFGIGILGFILLAVAQFWTSQFMPDRYADTLTIPDDIEIYEPIGDGWNIRPDSTLQINRKEFDFELYKSFQSGLYEYDIWLGKIDSGTVYLKVYEIAENDRLSKDGLTEQSSIRVGNLNEEIKRFGTQDHFTIYEGDWGKPYAARFEIWYQPDNGKENKLTEKNYIIEGWQR